MVMQITPHAQPCDAPTNNPTAAYAASQVIKASPGVMYGISGYNSNVAAQFIHLYDSITVPAEAAVPVEVIKVAAASSFNQDFGVHGKAFMIGMAWANSSTGPTKTIGAADCFISPRFK